MEGVWHIHFLSPLPLRPNYLSNSIIFLLMLNSKINEIGLLGQGITPVVPTTSFYGAK